MNGNRRLQPFFLKTCYIFLLFVSFISLSCGKKAVKPSEDSVLAQNALQQIELIKAAYETKDIGSLTNLTDAGLFGSLEKELIFDKAGLSFSTPRIIKISGPHVTVSVNWKGVWELESVIKKNRGSGSFVFLKESMRLVEIDGDNPFVVPAVNIK